MSHDEGLDTSAVPVPRLLLDAGTGLRRLRKLLGDRPFVGTIVLTHLHWDHVQGIPFFESGDREDARTTLFMPPQEPGEEAEAVLARMMSPPLFPIRPHQLRGSWTFAVLPPGAFSDKGIDVEGFNVMAREIPHKGGFTVGYRVSDGKATMAYLPDHCPTMLGPGPDNLGEYHPAALELAGGADVLIHDAHLVCEELPEQAAFGHAAAEYAVALGRRAGVHRVVLFHHRPDRTDDDIDSVVTRFSSSEDGVAIVGAADGMELTL